MSPELSKYVTSYVIGLPTSSEKRFYGEDRKPYSVSVASMDTMGMSMFSPWVESAKENKNLKFRVLKENIKKNLEQLMKVEILFRQNQVLWDNR